MQAGARGAGLLSNPNKPSSDWLKKMDVGALERGWGIVLTPPLPVLAGSSHTPQRTQTWRMASPGWLRLRTSTSLSLPKVSLCFWICRRADVIAAVSFYILLFKFLYCIWGLKRWAWFLIKPFQSEELFEFLLPRLYERFSRPDQILAHPELSGTMCHMFHSFRRVCMIGLVGDTRVYSLQRHPQLDGNVFLSRRKYSRNYEP